MVKGTWCKEVFFFCSMWYNHKSYNFIFLPMSHNSQIGIYTKEENKYRLDFYIRPKINEDKSKWIRKKLFIICINTTFDLLIKHILVRLVSYILDLQIIYGDLNIYISIFGVKPVVRLGIIVGSWVASFIRAELCTGRSWNTARGTATHDLPFPNWFKLQS